MQGVGPHVPPESVEADLLPRRPASSHFEHTCSYSQRCIRGDDLGTGNPFRDFTLSLGVTVRFPPCFSYTLAISRQRGQPVSRGTEMGKEIAITL